MQTRFNIGSTVDGYEVVDNDGRPVSDSFITANTPLQIAAALNAAATNGPKALARALGCIENEHYIIDDSFSEAEW